MSRTKKKTEPAPFAGLLERVTVAEVPDQEEDVTYALDREAGTAVVNVRPDVDPEARHTAQLRGALKLTLSGYGAYNEAITRKYDRFPSEQDLHDQAEADALDALEPLLLQVHPYTPAPASEA
ncbi:hypothetical protein GO986_16190 [Deinococcus sp. HMF7620]|uniref:Uncharacterized protein n=1 Tax=Deinococcus arboris TaxID=2682977 RepID=A0A7C9IDF3_9DEIO|nr:hypothetical protein [Deinococcus arboris]MVN88286.1 hypothetical protein [Deinococcus arboris]